MWTPTTVILLLILCAQQSFSRRSEIFSSMDSVERLVDIENELDKKIDTYLNDLNKQIETLDSFLEEYYSGYNLTESQADEYISNPINVYALIKRTSHGWLSVKDVIFNATGETTYRDISELTDSLASPSDIEGAVNAIFLLQDVYNLDIEALSEGIISVNGQVIRNGDESLALTATDMELIGKFAFNNHYFDRAYEWLTNALNKASKNAEQASTSKIISRIESELQTVIKYHDNILELKGSPRGPTWRTYVSPFDKELARKNKYKRAALEHNNGSRYYKLKPKLLVPLKEHEIGDQFAALCRGEELRDPKNESHLNCFDLHLKDPYLRLGPFQYEALHSRPNIGIIHSFLTEGEADTLISEGTSRSMERSHHSGRRRENEFSFKRTSKQVWLNEESLSSNRSLRDVEGVISKRLELASRFELSQGGSEDYQIVNYGLGGTYKPHFDSFDNEGLSKKGGDRLATALVYLSDVEAGGSTVFPLLGLQIPPSKGALVMWFNKEINGKKYFTSLHGGCPVLSGNKWIANKWIRNFQQWKNFPCATNLAEWFKLSRPMSNNYCDDRCY